MTLEENITELEQKIKRPMSWEAQDYFKEQLVFLKELKERRESDAKAKQVVLVCNPEVKEEKK